MGHSQGFHANCAPRWFLKAVISCRVQEPWRQDASAADATPRRHCSKTGRMCEIDRKLSVRSGSVPKQLPGEQPGRPQVFRRSDCTPVLIDVKG